MKLLREIIGRHLINGKVFEVISRSPKTIVVDADSEQVFVYQTGENGGKVESRLSMIPEVKIKRRVA